MKINWGTGIVIGFVLFISFIMFMVIKMTNNAEHELVTKDYYKQELVYQEEIDAEKNAQMLSENIKLTKTNKGYLITFPEELDYSKIKGTVSFYRPSSKKLDFTLPINLSSNQLLVPKSHLLEGYWGVTVKWDYNNIKYLFKDEVKY